MKQLFLLAFGGDGAPGVGTVFSVSFLNIGKRILSSSGTFMLFGADVEDSSLPSRCFALKEEVPLVKHYISVAKCEPLHLKNNICKELFIKVWKDIFGALLISIILILRICLCLVKTC